MTKNTTQLKAPWLDSYGDVKFNMKYDDISMCDAVRRSAEKNPKGIALSFMGKFTDYETLAKKIDIIAKAFIEMGIKDGEKVTICMPNCPQAVIAMYALNRMGAIASMIHPLSAENEIVHFINEVDGSTVIILDMFYTKFQEIEKKIPLKNIIVATIADELSPLKKVAYKLFAKGIPKHSQYKENVILWNDLVKKGASSRQFAFDVKTGDDSAIVLFSGGTTGVSKGILLTNLNFNALAMQTEAMNHNQIENQSLLAAMPIFHGFGLGICIHSALFFGGKSILVPRFNVKSYAKLIRDEKPNYIAGVPTLFEAITREDVLKDVDLSFLKGVFSGGDSLSVELKKKIDNFLKEHNASIKVREGYGTTECVTASCLTPYHMEKEGSIGLPYPDTYYKICKVGTMEEVPYGEDGEICLTGPTLMKCYLNNEEETAQTLKTHEDGNTWLHTGDLGNMDSDGFIFFKQRIKRVIVSSGYNIYPSQIENALESHEAVQLSCVIGVHDQYKIQKVKAFIVLKNGYKPSEEIKKSILTECAKSVAKYAMPKEVEFRDTLPTTLVGKVAYKVLEDECANSINNDK